MPVVVENRHGQTLDVKIKIGRNLHKTWSPVPVHTIHGENEQQQAAKIMDAITTETLSNLNIS